MRLGATRRHRPQRRRHHPQRRRLPLSSPPTAVSLTPLPSSLSYDWEVAIDGEGSERGDECRRVAIDGEGRERGRSRILQYRQSPFLLQRSADEGEECALLPLVCRPSSFAAAAPANVRDSCTVCGPPPPPLSSRVFTHPAILFCEFCLLNVKSLPPPPLASLSVPH